MGFWKKLFGRGKIEDKIQADTESKTFDNTFDIDTIEQFLNNQYNDIFQSFKEYVRSKYEDVQSKLLTFKSSLAKLGKATFSKPEGGVNLALVQKLLAQRKSFINKMKLMIDKLSKPMGDSFDSITSYQISVLNSIKTADKYTSREFASFEQLFKEESKLISNNFRSLFTVVKNFDKFVSEKKDSFASISNARNEFEALKKYIRISKDREKELDDLNKHASDLKENLSSEKRRLKDLESGEEWKKFNDLTEDKTDMESQMSEVKFLISQNLSIIEKPLKKFQNLVFRGVEKLDNSKELDKYIDSPVDMLIATKDFAYFRSILRSICNDISSEKINIKNRDKTLSKINWIIDHNVFEELVEKYNPLVNKLKTLEDDISKQIIVKEKQDVENHIEDLERESNSVTEKLVEIKKQVEKSNNLINTSKSNLEKLLSSFISGEAKINI